jgi:hypothetical protein
MLINYCSSQEGEVGGIQVELTLRWWAHLICWVKEKCIELIMSFLSRSSFQRRVRTKMTLRTGDPPNLTTKKLLLSQPINWSLKARATTRRQLRRPWKTSRIASRAPSRLISRWICRSTRLEARRGMNRSQLKLKTWWLQTKGSFHLSVGGQITI